MSKALDTHQDHVFMYKAADLNDLLSFVGHPKQRSTTPRNVCSPKPGESRDAEKQFIQKLKEKCDEQSRQLSNIRDELKRTSCGFDVFAITTQHFFRQVSAMNTFFTMGKILCLFTPFTCTDLFLAIEVLFVGA